MRHFENLKCRSRECGTSNLKIKIKVEVPLSGMQHFEKLRDWMKRRYSNAAVQIRIMKYPFFLFKYFCVFCFCYLHVYFKIAAAKEDVLKALEKATAILTDVSSPVEKRALKNFRHETAFYLMRVCMCVIYDGTL